MASSIGNHTVVLNAEVSGLVQGMKAGTAATLEFHRAQGKAASSFQAGSKAASKFGVMAQSAGYQVQDFFVQAAGGQSLMSAFTQQASQFLGVFGPTGAIAGAVLAVGGLVYKLASTEANTKEAEKAATKLEKEYKAIEDRLIKVRDAWAEINALHGSAYRTTNPRSEKDTLAYRAGLSGEAMPKLLNAAKDAEGFMMIANARGNTDEARRQQDIMLAAEKKYAEVRQEVADIDAEIAKTRLSESEAFDKQSREEEDANTKRYQAIGSQAQAITDQLRPMEKVRREIKEIRDNIFLSHEDKRAAIDAMLSGMVKSPASIPASMQVTAGASALGGSFADGGMVLDIQKNILKGVEETVSVLRAQLNQLAGL